MVKGFIAEAMYAFLFYFSFPASFLVSHISFFYVFLLINAIKYIEHTIFALQAYYSCQY